jgi:hypothetical protein
VKKGAGSPFPGDHETKQSARMFLYKHARAAPVQGHAVTLAGTDPGSEVKLMRDYLQWPAHRAWFVDRANTREVRDSLRKIDHLWPGVNVRNIDLQDLAPYLEAIGFANLDFMGAPLADDNLQCLKDVIPLLLPGAILGLTWIRGRENMSIHLSARRLWRLGKGFRGNERRWAGVLKAINIISNGELKLIDKWEYFSNHSPMSVAVFRK